MTTINLDNFFQSIKATLDQIKTDLSSIGIDVTYVGPGSEIDGDGNADDATITFGTASETLITDAGTNGIYSGNGYFNIIVAGTGNDTLVGGAGYDLLFGGSGADAADYSYLNGGSNGVWADLNEGVAVGGINDVDRLNSIENLIGSVNDDVLMGNSQNNVFYGNGGNDVIDGRGGIDVVQFAGNPEDYTVTPVMHEGDVIGYAFSKDGETTKVIGIEFAQFTGMQATLFSIQNADGTDNGSVIAVDDDAAIHEDQTITLTPLDNDQVLGVVAQKLISFTGADENELAVTYETGTDQYGALVVQGDYGTLTLNADGSVTYVPGDAADALQEGEQAEEVFTYKVAGGDIATITLNITGTNDGPQLSGPAFGPNPVTEVADGGEIRFGEPAAEGDFGHGTGGSFTVTDVDSNFGGSAAAAANLVTVSGPTATFIPVEDGHTLPASFVSQLNDFIINLAVQVDGPGATLTVGYQFEVKDAQIEFLGEGDVLQLHYVITVQDGNGGSVPKNVTINIVGKNDALEITSVADPASVEEALDSAVQDISVIGTINVTDIDANDVLTPTFGAGTATIDGVAIDENHPNWAAIEALLDAGNIEAHPAISNGGAVGIPFTFAANDVDLDFLAEGDTLVLTFPVTVGDGVVSDGDFVTITITGTDDAPTLGAVTSGSIAEVDQSSTTTDAGLSGTLAGDDVDGDTLTYGIQGGTDNGDGTVSFIGTYGMLTVDTTTGAYTFVKNAAAIEALDDGDTDSDVFTVTVSDGDGPAVTQTYTVNVAGANDAPTLGFVQDFETGTDGITSGGLYGAITTHESGENGIVTPDGGDYALVTESIYGPFTRFDGYRSEFVDGMTASVSVYLDVDWAAGSGFDYSVAATGSDGGFQRDFIFHVTKDTSTGELLVGGSNNTNFAPRQDLETINHFVVEQSGWYTLQHVFRDEGGYLAVDLNLVDANGNIVWTETRTTTQDPIAEIGGNRYGWFTDVSVPGGLAIDDVTLGQFQGGVTEVADNAANEGTASLEASGTIPFIDVDLGDSHEVDFEAIGEDYVGTFAVEIGNEATGDGEGTVVWTFSVPDSVIDGLGEGEKLVQHYTVTLTDEAGMESSQVVTITITGTNDAPTIDLGASQLDGEVIENTATSTTQGIVSGNILFDDVDENDNPTAEKGDVTFSYTPNTAAPGGYLAGSSTSTLPAGLNAAAIAAAFMITPEGAWSFDASELDLEGLAAGDVLEVGFEVVVSDGNDGTATTTVTITITGTNDAPTIDALSGLFDEDDLDDLVSGINLLDAGNAQDVDGDDFTVVDNSLEGMVTINFNDEFGPDGDYSFGLPIQALVQTGLVSLAADGTFTIDDNLAFALKLLMDGNDTLSIDGSFKITDGAAQVTAQISSLFVQGLGDTADDTIPDYGTDAGEIVPEILVPTFDGNGDPNVV